jgi:parallel beta-helix repeat protein
VNNIVGNNLAKFNAGINAGMDWHLAITLLIEGNFIHNNHATANVAGMSVWGSGCTAYIRKNVIIDNLAENSIGGLTAGDSVTAYIDGNYIARNISGFSHNGIYLWRTNKNNLIINNIIRNNIGYGIALGNGAGLTSYAQIINNTLVGNTYGINAYVNSNSRAYVMNNILKNTGSELVGTIFASYNLVEGGYAGTGNIDADPKFRLDDSLYHFVVSSPCNGGGARSDTVGGVLLTAPAYDFFGVARPTPNFPGARPDIGAVEMPFNPPPDEVRDLGVGLPAEFSLSQNYPNPFNPSTTIRYALPSSAHVRLTVYDMLGREVETLINEEQSAGWKEYEWNAGTRSSGIYFYTIQAGANTETKKLMLLK